MSESEDEIIRQHARMEWNAAAPGWKKYGDPVKFTGELILGTANKPAQWLLR